MMYIRTSVILVFVALATLAKAEPAPSIVETYLRCKEAIRFLEEQKPSNDLWKATYCIGYMRGIATILNANCEFFQKDIYPLAINTGSIPNVNVAARIFVKWMDDHPKEFTRDEDFISVILATELPCKK